ncbi:MAG TPA: hypothetical protein VI670_12870 [Thermoanaerobaculia bacterium]|jgi:hypothetical protein
MNDYLWDRSGDDEEVRKLEELLGAFKAPSPRFAGRGWRAAPGEGRRSRLLVFALPLAAMIILGIALPAFLAYRNAGWQAGAIAVYRAGDVIRAKAPLRIETPSIGVVDVGAGATLHVVSKHRLALDVGTIHAKTTSPPGLFVVDTPSTQAVDLGCEYVLDVANDHSGTLHVTEGWVELGDGFVQSLVPRGASATFTADGRLSPPVFDDASTEFKDAVRRHDVPRLTATARPRDALTLINLLRHAYGDERRVLFDRLAELVPPPPSVTFDSIRWDEWWLPVLKASGVESLKKKKR